MADALDTVGTHVFEFYRQLPFNVTELPASTARAIERSNSVLEYPPLARILNPRTRTLDVGCGGGWLANSIATHYKASVVGIDFNPTAIEFARAVAAILKVNTAFEQTDLFKFIPKASFDVVVSLGVLHHTADCLGAIRHICRHSVRPNGFFFLGLYHLHGRRPFLEHFRQMESKGASRQAMLAEFNRLIGDQAIDPTHLLSWYRDQVEHPHETQHTVVELAPVFKEEGFEVLTTSLNDYGKPDSLPEIEEQEKRLEDVARQRLASGSYYPGFFCVLARRKGQ